MKAELKTFDCLTISDLEHYVPKNPDNFSFTLDCYIGPKNLKGEELFYFQVCTPKWLMNNYKEDEVIFAKGMIVVFEYNFPLLLNKLKRLIENTEGGSWKEIAEKLSKYSDWEFEDYKEQ